MIYIGQTINVDRRWQAHKSFAKKPEQTGQYIHRAMAKYGIENFVYEVIACCKTQQDANETEDILISQYDSINKGYNLVRGGHVISGKDHPQYGKKQSAEWKAKKAVSSAWYLNAPRSKEIKQKISQSLMGHTFTPETLEKMSKAKIGKSPSNKGTKGIMKPNHTSFAKGKPSPNKGRKRVFNPDGTWSMR